MNVGNIRERFERMESMFHESRDKTIRRMERAKLLGVVLDRAVSPNPEIRGHLERVTAVLSREYDDLASCGPKLDEISRQIAVMERLRAKGTPQSTRFGALGRLHRAVLVRMLSTVLNTHFCDMERELADTDRDILVVLDMIEHRVRCESGLDGR